MTTTKPTRRSVMETTLDRVLTRRLRPLRDELRAARQSAESQATLRAEAEVRAARAEDEAAALRVQLAQLSRELTVVNERPASWWRRRRAAEEQPA